MAHLCIDLGTSLIKTVAFDDNGANIALARQKTEVFRPKPGYSEQDMLSVWDAVVFTIRTVVHQLHDQVHMIALTGQGDGCWLISSDGEPTGPAILWNDGRATALVEQWRQAGILEQVFRINGSLQFAGLPHAILTWLKHNESERIERADKSLYCDGWIFFKLTGEKIVDESDASAPFLDIRTRRYSSEILKLYGLEWAERLLPEVRSDAQRVAPLQASAAAQLGLPPGLPVVICPYDVASTALGAGAVSAGQACSILGTTLCTEILTDQLHLEGEPSGLTIAMPSRRPPRPPWQYLRAFPTLAGTEVIAWAMTLLGLQEPDELSALAKDVEPGAGGLLFLPYLSPAGERAPFLNSAARGMFLGLSFEHDRRHIARAILEGLTLVIRDCFEASKASPTELHVCGGGANSVFWCQMIADVTGVPTIRSTDSEVGAKGAFLCGLVSTGVESDYAHAATSYVKIRDTFEPNRERSSRYTELYQEFLALRDISATAWPRLAAARAATSQSGIEGSDQAAAISGGTAA
jgi:erythritol kinase